MSFFIRSFIRKRSASLHTPGAGIRFCTLGEQQPLILHREPNNPHDACAVRVTDLYGGHCGYVAREDACKVSLEMIKTTLLCKTDGPCECYSRNIIIWSDDGRPQIEVKTKKTKKLEKVK